MEKEKKVDIEAIENVFKKLGITKENYPKFDNYESFSNTFKQITMYEKPGKITSSSSVNA